MTLLSVIVPLPATEPMTHASSCPSWPLCLRRSVKDYNSAKQANDAKAGGAAMVTFWPGEMPAATEKELAGERPAIKHGCPVESGIHCKPFRPRR